LELIAVRTPFSKLNGIQSDHISQQALGEVELVGFTGNLRACEIIKTAQIHVNTDYTSSVKGNTCSMQQIQPMPTKMPPSLFPDLPELAQLPIKNPKAHRHDLKAPARVLTPNRLQVDSPQQP